MNGNKSLNNPDFDNEPDEISSPVTSHNTYGHSSAINQDDITLEDEKNLAGYNDDLPQLLSKEYRIKQDSEEPEERPTSEKPTVRTGLVLTATAAVMGVTGLIWFGFLAPKSPRQQATKPTPTPLPPNPVENESAQLKAKLAFADQRRQVETKPDVQKQPTTPIKPQPSPAPVAKTPSSSRPVPVRQVSPPPPPPRTVFVRQPSPPPSLPRTVFVRQPSSPRIIQDTQPIPVRPKTPAQPIKVIDPTERWSELADLGQSRGSTVSETAVANNFEPPTSEPSADYYPTSATHKVPPPLSAENISPPISTALSNQNIPSPVSTTPSNQNISPPISRTLSTPDNPTPTSTRTQQPSTQMSIPTVFVGYTSPTENSTATIIPNMTDGEKGILTRTPVAQNNSNEQIANRNISTTKEVAIATSTNARVIVPMIWNESGASPTSGRFAIQLTEDMRATDGTVALPTGTILVTQVESVNQANKLVDMSVGALVYPDSQGRIRQEVIPPGTLSIRGQNNQPLIAQGLFDKGREIAKQDLLVGVLSSLGKVGEVINQPRTQSSNSSSSFGFSQTTVTTSREPSVLAAALEGFFKTTAQRLEKRSDKTVQEILQKPNVAVVPEGTNVSVFVNSFLHVRR